MNSNQKQKAAEEEVAEYKQEAESFKVEDTSPPLPPSASSSPSHEFSFTTPLHSSSSSSSSHKAKAKAKPTPPSFAIDLSPADDIFFHGHLLPLHLLSHLPSSPRSSTTSIDSFTIPIKHFWHHQDPIKDTSSCSISGPNHHPTAPTEPGGRTKSKPFSLFGFPKWRKGCDTTEQNDRGNHKRKLGFDVTQVLKRYARMVRPLLLFRWRKESFHIRRQAHSFSGNLNPRNKQEQLRGRRGEFSAPASMRTSPTNSGLLVASTPSMTSSSSSSDSTMEELQSAIQAAIAHCKNSIAKEDKTNVESCH